MGYKGIIIKKMSNSDIGRDITYIDVFHGNETGKVKSFDNEKQTAFVVFKCNNDWDNYQNYTAQSCKYINLEF